MAAANSKSALLAQRIAADELRREDARMAGKHLYEALHVCKRGHTTRFVLNKTCAICSRTWEAAKRAAKRIANPPVKRSWYDPTKLHLGSAGYLFVAAPNHPLRRAGYRVGQHRIVYYDAHGAGPFDCHWCGKNVTWETLHIDHVDNDKKNNNLSNLVASCHRCNCAIRGNKRRVDTLREKRGIVAHGEKLLVTEWAKRLGISYVSILQRLETGWPPELAVSLPRGSKRPDCAKRVPTQA